MRAAGWRFIDPIPDVDVDKFHRLMLRLEADAHRLGWEHLPQLRVVYDDTAADGETDRTFRRHLGQRIGNATRVDGYAAQLLVRAEILDMMPGTPWEKLGKIAFNMAFADPGTEAVDAGRALLTQPGVLGFMYVTLRWKLEGATREEYEAFAAGKIEIADHPKGREVRVVHAVDATGRLHFAERVRGRKPEVLPEETRGDLSNALRLLMDGLTGRAPTDQGRYDDRYRSLTETATASRYVRTAVERALPYVDRGEPFLALASFHSDLAKFDGDRNALAEYDPPAIAAAFPEGREAVLTACLRAGLGPVG